MRRIFATMTTVLGTVLFGVAAFAESEGGEMPVHMPTWSERLWVFIQPHMVLCIATLSITASLLVFKLVLDAARYRSDAQFYIVQVWLIWIMVVLFYGTLATPTLTAMYLLLEWALVVVLLLIRLDTINSNRQRQAVPPS